MSRNPSASSLTFLGHTATGVGDGLLPSTPPRSASSAAVVAHRVEPTPCPPQRKRPRTASGSYLAGDEEWRLICQNARSFACDSLPGLDEAARMFGYHADGEEEGEEGEEEEVYDGVVDVVGEDQVAATAAAEEEEDKVEEGAVDSAAGGTVVETARAGPSAICG